MLQAIREKRSQVVDQMRSITEAAANEERDLTEKEDRTFNELKGDLAKLDKQLERAQVITDAERSMATVEPVTRGFDGSFENQCRGFQITKAIAHQLDPTQVDAGREIEISQELARRNGKSPSGIYCPHEVFLEKRDILTSNTGAELIPEVHRSDLYIDRLAASIQAQAAGATVLSGLVGNIDIPRMTAGATGYWVAEHNAVTESSPTFDTVEMAAKTVGTYVEYSRRMIINAVPSVEQLVRNDLARTIALAIDDKAFSGDGTGNTPTGITNTSGINSVSFGGAPTWSKVLDFISAVGADNALMGSLGWATNPYAVKTMRKTVKVASTDSVMIMQEPGSLAGYPVFQSTQIAGNPTTSPIVNSTLIFGNFSDLLIGYWSGVDILANPYHTDVFAKGGVLISAFQDCDIDVRHPESFAVATDMVDS